MPPQKTTKLKFISIAPINVTIDNKDFHFSFGEIFDLSLENPYIASLKEQGYFEEVLDTDLKKTQTIKKS